MDLMNLAGHFLFGGGYQSSDAYGVTGEQLYDRLYNPREEQVTHFWAFIHAVKAQSLENAAVKEPNQFLSCWATKKVDCLEPWTQLDATCRLREDVDLGWAPIAIGEFLCATSTVRSLGCLMFVTVHEIS